MEILEKPLEEYRDRVAEIFAEKTLLLTGVTGFIGKVLLEKLLRACPKITKIYVLIRSKYNLTPEARLALIFDSSLFNLLRQQDGIALFGKVEAIEGDLAASNLALSARTRGQLITRVNIVYHCAALLRFDETLKRSVLMNVRGTKLILDLAKQMRQLALFAHVSSAYCHLHERIIYERPYEPPVDPLRMIRICECLDDASLSSLTHKILDQHPNTYCFCKSLSEGLINAELDKMPVILLRPSLVLPAWKEPIPGWTDTINGTLGFQIVSGKGILRTLHADVGCYPDLIPVDIAVNAFLCATFDYLHHKNKGKPPRNIYNLTTSDKHKVSWLEILDLGRQVVTGPVPLNWVVWYPGGSVKKWSAVHNTVFYLLHIAPSVLIDSILIVFNQRPILLPIFRRVLKGFDIIRFYHGKQWDFNNKQALEARDALNPLERSKYNLDGDEFDYFEYFCDCAMCARRFILNESDDTLPRAKQHLKMMYYVDKFAITLTVFWLVSWIYGHISKNWFNYFDL